MPSYFKRKIYRPVARFTNRQIINPIKRHPYRSLARVAGVGATLAGLYTASPYVPMALNMASEYLSAEHQRRKPPTARRVNPHLTESGYLKPHFRTGEYVPYYKADLSMTSS